MNKLGTIRTLFVASLTAVGLAVPIALAQSNTAAQNGKQLEGEWHGRHLGAHHWQKQSALFEGLSLPDEQKTRIKQIGSAFGESTKSLRQELRTKRQELRQASQGGTFNEALATQKLQEMAGLQAKLLAARFKMRQETLSVLTPEQKTQLDQKRAEFKTRWAERRERQVQ